MGLSLAQAAGMCWAQLDLPCFASIVPLLVGMSAALWCAYAALAKAFSPRVLQPVLVRLLCPPPLFGAV